MNLPYDIGSKDSILDYALILVDKSLRQVLDNQSLESNLLNKGGFGQILEKYYFFKDLDSTSQPDFPEAALELKSSPLRRLRKQGELRAKERLVLNIINYETLINQDFFTSSFYTKNASLLLVFYFYDKERDVLDYKIKLVGIWDFPEEDLKVIEHDWRLIKRKVELGQAHTLSEGDTFYLGACTKGASAQSVRKQPYSDIPAKQRAFSLKIGYVNHIIAKLSGNQDGRIGKLLKAPNLKVENFDIEEIVLKKIEPYYGKTPEEISLSLDVQYNPESKQRFAQLSQELIKRILGVENKQEVEEFSKADITLKTVRLNEEDLPYENLSFSAFKYEQLLQEHDWELSSFNEQLEKMFLFIFFKITEDNKYALEKAVFWNMPYKDRLEAKKVWEHIKLLIRTGCIVKEVTPKGIYKTYFPKQAENRVAHVRPHARHRDDTYPLPIPDQLTSKTEYMKHSFWLNTQYIRDSVYLKNTSATEQ